MVKIPSLAIVIPCHNEQEVIAETIRQLLIIFADLEQKQKINSTSFIFLVDDGSRDETWSVIEKLRQQSPVKIKAIKLSRNFGHQNALLAGLLTVKKYADCIISMDADLQHDINSIETFIEQFQQGGDIVYGVRNERITDTWFKRHLSQFFYRLMYWFGADVIYNHADYRLISKRVADTLENFKERNLFLRGIFPLMGYKATRVYYDQKERLAGESKYNLKKMIAFALNGITSFSAFPLRLITFIGFTVFIIAIIISGYTLFEALVLKRTVSGWASIVLSIYFIGGIQLLCLGVIGEYLGKMFQEIKARPRYIIEKELI